MCVGGMGGRVENRHSVGRSDGGERCGGGFCDVGLSSVGLKHELSIELFWPLVGSFQPFSHSVTCKLSVFFPPSDFKASRSLCEMRAFTNTRLPMQVAT